MNEANGPYVKKMEAVVFAGGKGRSHAKELPDELGKALAKPLTPIGGIPLMDYLLKTLPATGVHTINLMLRELDICDPIKDRTTIEFPQVSVWKFPARYTMTAELLHLAEIQDFTDPMYRIKKGINGSKKEYFLNLNTNSLYPKEMLEDVIKTAERMFSEDRGLNIILFYTKMAPVPKTWELDSNNPFEKRLMEKNASGYSPTVSVMKIDAIKQLPYESLVLKEDEQNNFLGSPIHLAKLIEEKCGGVKEHDLSYIVGHYDQDSDIPVIEEIAKGIKATLDAGLGGFI